MGPKFPGGNASGGVAFLQGNGAGRASSRPQREGSQAIKIWLRPSSEARLPLKMNYILSLRYFPWSSSLLCFLLQRALDFSCIPPPPCIPRRCGLRLEWCGGQAQPSGICHASSPSQGSGCEKPPAAHATTSLSPASADFSLLSVIITSWPGKRQR